MTRLFCSSVFVCIAVVTMAPRVCRADTTIAIVSHTRQAPLDRYFGKLAMSPIGVGNAIRNVADRADAKLVDAPTAIAGLALVEDSVKDWESQFPADTWLPHMLMSIKRVYHKYDDSNARESEARISAWITSRYPESDEARTCLAEADARDAIADSAFADHTDPMPGVLKP